MLHAKFLHSPYANAQGARAWIRRRPERSPGVVDIVTWEDEVIKNLVSGGEHGAAPRPWLDNLADQEGAEVAVIVVAENEDICEDALGRSTWNGRVLPHVVDLLVKARKPDAFVIRPTDRSTPQFRMPDPNAPPNPPKQGNVAYSNVIQGDVEDGFKQADHIMEYDMYMPCLLRACPQPTRFGGVVVETAYTARAKPRTLKAPSGDVLPRSARMYDTPLEKVVQEGLFMGGRYCDWGLASPRKSRRSSPKGPDVPSAAS